MAYETYTAQVYGIAWAGYKASTEYDFMHKPTRAEVLARAGDFERVTRIELRKTVTTVERAALK